MNPLNKEHFDAEQEEFDRIRTAFIEKLPPKGKKKFDAVSRAVAILNEEEILFFLYPMLPSEVFIGKEQVWQWNSLASKIIETPDGKMTTTNKEENKNFHSSLLTLIFQQFSPYVEGRDANEKLNNWPHFLWSQMKRFFDYTKV